jgi:hypothetical protein
MTRARFEDGQPLNPSRIKIQRRLDPWGRSVLTGDRRVYTWTMPLLAQGQENMLAGILVLVTSVYYLAHLLAALPIHFARRKPGWRPVPIVIGLLAVAELGTCASQRREMFSDGSESIWYWWTAPPARLALLAIWGQLRPSKEEGPSKDSAASI